MRSIAIIFCAILVLFSFSQIQATIIHVPGDSSTIQGGINGAVNGDTILVAPGTYYEHINFDGKAIAVMSEAGAERTVISKLVDELALVTFESGEDTMSVIDGFTIRDATISGLDNGAILCNNSSPTIKNNILMQNAVAAVVCFQSSGGYFDNNVIKDNPEAFGIMCWGDQNRVTISRNLIFGNFFGIDTHGDDDIINNTFSSNDVNLNPYWTATIKNNIIVNGGQGIYNSSGGLAEISYNDVWGNTENYAGDPTTPGQGDISADPMFCDPQEENYYLHWASPCLGAGEGGANMGAFGASCGVVSVTSGPDQSGQANTLVSVVFYVESVVDSIFTCQLHVSDGLGWDVVPTYAEMTLTPYQRDSITLTVSIPNVITGTVDPITVRATSHPDSIELSQATSAVTVSPRIIYVPEEQSSIQAGINFSRSGDTVLVAPGTYYEHPNFTGKPIVLKSEKGADSTVISMLAGGVSMVSFISGEDSNSVLDGFTITGAFLEVGQGAGIKCQNSSPKIVNNRIVANSCPYGAGIDCDDYSSPIIANNVIEQNPSTSSGGGIRCNNHSSPVIRENLIIDNSAVESGAGIWCEDNCSPTIAGNLIAQNTAGTGYGGGIGLLNSSVADIIDNTIDANSASTGGGIYMGVTSSATIQNTIVTNTTSGKGVRYDGASPIFLYYCDVWNNLDQDYYGCLPGDGCISADPVYCDPINGDFSLWAGSPCLGAGQEGGDIGAFGQGCSVVGDANGDGEVNIGDVVYLVSYLYKAGPAPQPIPAGDVNCDGLINVGDIVYLVNYLFKGGPPPCEP